MVKLDIQGQALTLILRSIQEISFNKTIAVKLGRFRSLDLDLMVIKFYIHDHINCESKLSNVKFIEKLKYHGNY